MGIFSDSSYCVVADTCVSGFMVFILYLSFLGIGASYNPEGSQPGCNESQPGCNELGVLVDRILRICCVYTRKTQLVLFVVAGVASAIASGSRSAIEPRQPHNFAGAR